MPAMKWLSLRLQLKLIWFIICLIAMRTYIFALVLTSETGKDEAKAKKLVESLVTESGGKVTDSKILGSRELAYKIKGANSGWYGFFTVEMPEDKVKSLGNKAKVSEQVLRHLLLAKQG